MLEIKRIEELEDETVKGCFADTEVDNINHPSHYCQEGSVECIDEMIAVFGIYAVMNFCLCNVWKYRKRAMFKNGQEDIKKSDWYMKKYLELSEKRKSSSSEDYNFGF